VPSITSWRAEIDGIKEPSRPKSYRQKRNWSTVGAEQVLERVSEHFQSDLETPKERGIRNNLARRCTITLCWDHAGLSQDGIPASLPFHGDVENPIRLCAQGGGFLF
jgi:hypothetical protein